MTMRRFAAVLTLVLLSTTAASAQILDDTWFKLKIKTRGTEISSSGALSTETFKTEVFLHLTLDAEGDPVEEDYEVDVFARNNAGEFVQVPQKGSFLSLIQDGNDGAAGLGIFVGDVSEGVPGFDDILVITALLRVKFRLTSESSLRSARLRSLAGFTQVGNAFNEGNGDVVLGDSRLRAKTVPVSKLPFSPTS